MEPILIGIIGCGNISDAYLRGAEQSKLVAVKSVSDQRPEAAAEKASDYEVDAVTQDEMLSDPDISIVINLTIPSAHADVSTAILGAGKHVYSEKPLAITLADARLIMDRAHRSGLRVGSAPDTFLGASHQIVRRLVDSDRVGKITGGSVTFATPGMEMWHPNPFFFFQPGGGPVLDIGCYPITQLVNCLGPVASVMAHASKGREVRTVTNGPHDGAEIPVEVFTTVNGALSFHSGANIAFTASWDVWKHARSPIELYGTEGTILNPDPNFFGGDVQVSDRNGDWQTVAIESQPFWRPNLTMGGGREAANYRMAGVFDMAAALKQGRAHRANGEMALHVLEVMEGLERSSLEGRRIEMKTRCKRPEPVPPGEDETVFLQ